MAFEQFFFDNPIPCWAYEETTLKFLAVNNSAVAVYGFSEEEFLEDLLVTDLELQENDPNSISSHKEPSETIHTSPVIQHQTKSGKIIHVHICSHPTKLNGLPCRYVMALNADEDLVMKYSSGVMTIAL